MPSERKTLAFQCPSHLTSPAIGADTLVLTNGVCNALFEGHWSVCGCPESASSLCVHQQLVEESRGHPYTHQENG